MNTPSYAHHEYHAECKTPQEKEMGSLYWCPISINGITQWHLIQKCHQGYRHFHTGEIILPEHIQTVIPFLKKK